jgi:hypothetical protein
MKSSNLARSLEMESQLEMLRLTPQPSTRFLVAQPMSTAPEKPRRRAARTSSIQCRDQGLRSFRVT